MRRDDAHDLRHVRRLHEAVVRGDLEEAPAEILDLQPVGRRGSPGTVSVMTESRTTVSWSTWLCFQWCKRTIGTPCGFDDMNTAVPDTRCGLCASTSARNTSMGSSWLARLRPRSARPVFHVVITRKSARAMAIGNHPPLKNFMALAAKKGMSKLRKTATSGSACQRGHFHARVSTTKYTIEVIAIVPVTAIPYAAASALDSLNESTRQMHAIARAALTSGT